jgi:hypothetical protein
MSTFHGVLVRPLAEQADRDGDRIDPAGVKIKEPRVVITANFDANHPLGTGIVSRAEDGSLVVDGTLNDGPVAALGGLKLAIGVVVGKRTVHKAGGSVTKTSTLMSVALTGEHSDPEQPVIKIEP